MIDRNSEAPASAVYIFIYVKIVVVSIFVTAERCTWVILILVQIRVIIHKIWFLSWYHFSTEQTFVQDVKDKMVQPTDGRTNRTRILSPPSVDTGMWLTVINNDRLKIPTGLYILELSMKFYHQHLGIIVKCRKRSFISIKENVGLWQISCWHYETVYPYMAIEVRQIYG